MIQVGLVGVGPFWERFRPALSRLRRPINVEAVYDPVFARAETAAKDLDADPVPGITALARLGNVEAILVMDPAWTRTGVLPLLARQPKPVFFAPWPFSGQDQRKHPATWGTDSDSVIVPAMWRRFFPAAIRLQELFATELGQPHEISINFAKPSSSAANGQQEATSTAATPTLESLVGWLDFCRTMFRAFPVSASVSQTPASDSEASASDNRFDFEFAFASVVTRNSSSETSSGNAEQARTATLSLRQASCTEPSTPASFIGNLMAGVKNPSLLTPVLLEADDAQPWIPEIRLRCERGSAVLNSTTKLSWQLEATERTHETLNADRSEEEIMLDIFCRRVVGGLVPVADLNDLLRPIQLLRSCVGL